MFYGIKYLIVTLVFFPPRFLEWESFSDSVSLNVFTASKGSNNYILFAITAAGVVQCGGPKKSPRTSSIVQIIFFF